MFPPFVDFAEKVRLFEAHFVQNADIIHRRFRLVNRHDKLFFTAFGCVRLKTLTRQKQISTVLFRDVFLPFSLSECVRHQKTTWIARIPQEGRAWSHWSSLWPLICWYFADILQKTVLLRRCFFITVEILVKAAVAVGGRIDDSCVSAVDLFALLRYNQKR